MRKMTLDETINQHNQTKFGDWNWTERVTLELINDLTGKTIKVTLEGDFVTCKNCRDKILEGFTWHQGKVERERIE